MNLRPRAISLALVLAGTGCTHVDVKARENLRLGPLREVRAVPVDVDHVVTVDAGTDAFTDAELTAVEQALAPALEASFAKLAGQDGPLPLVRTGTARVGACKLRAGPNKRFVVYLAKCHVSLVVDGVIVAEATGEGLRRTESVFLRKNTARPQGQERDPLVEVAESRAALIGALDAAARVLVEGPLPRVEGEVAVLSREERAALARTRLASASTSQEKVAALFDLRSSGVPADAALADRHLEDRVPAPPVEAEAPVEPEAASRLLVGEAAPPPDDADAPAPRAADAENEAKRAEAEREEAKLDVAVVAAAIDAIGELCEPSLKARVEGVPSEADDVIGRAKARALPRLRACAAIGR